MVVVLLCTFLCLIFIIYVVLESSPESSPESLNYFPVDICLNKIDGTIIRENVNHLDLCEGGILVRKTCNNGVFDENKICNTDDSCRGYEDGTYFEHIHPLFRFTSYIFQCEHEDLIHQISCTEKFWHPSENNADLRFIPYQVINNTQQSCEVPRLCENVLPMDYNAIVPGSEFQNAVRDWQAAPMYDQLYGFRCDFDIEKQELPPGKIIRDFRIVDNDCEDYYPTLDPTVYYDCVQKSTLTCQGGTFFDPVRKTCVLFDTTFFTFRNFPIFKVLGVKNWFEPRPLLEENPVICRHGEIRLPNFNRCADAICEKYPFLAQVKQLAILLDNGRCQQAQDGRIEFIRSSPNPHLHFDYWRQTFTSHPPEPCVPNETIRSGFFPADSTVFATCDDREPFVFCPSRETEKITVDVITGGHICWPRTPLQELKVTEPPM